jgi:hypothetical protein
MSGLFEMNLHLFRSENSGLSPLLSKIENWLDYERDQLPLWLPVMIGVGIGRGLISLVITGLAMIGGTLIIGFLKQAEM